MMGPSEANCPVQPPSLQELISELRNNFEEFKKRHQDQHHQLDTNLGKFEAQIMSLQRFTGINDAKPAVTIRNF